MGGSADKTEAILMEERPSLLYDLRLSHLQRYINFL